MDVVRLPVWLPGEDGRRRRACRVTCFSDEEGRVLESEVGTEAELPSLLETVLARASRKWSAPPARVEVADAALAGLLEPILAPRAVPVEKVAAMPEELRSLQSLLLDRLTPFDPRPSPLTGPGVTLARLAAFARAAAALYESPVWRLLTGFDAFRVEAPEVEAELRYFVVDCGFGPARELAGLLFEPGDEGEREGLEGWTVALERPWNAPPDDLDLWERYGLPWAGDGRCPVAWYEDEEPERPDHRRLAFFEGLLLALAATSEQELDAGRWEKTVRTAGGPVRFVLSLPDLLEARPAPEPEGETAEERALSLLEAAQSLLGRRRIALARRALEIWPGCAEAWLFLAHNASGLESVLDILARGVEACRPILAPESLPFLELLRNLGDTLATLNRCEDAAAVYSEVLELAPLDPVGARYGFVSVLLALGRDAEAGELLDRLGDDSATLLAWPRVLLSFRRQGDSLEVRRLLKKARQANGVVAGLLLKRLSVAQAARQPVGVQGVKEAGLYLALSCDTWKTTPGALDWLRARVAPAEQAQPRKKKRKR